MDKRNAVKIVNLTPHVVNYFTGTVQIAFQPSGKIARIASRMPVAFHLDYNGEYIPVCFNDYSDGVQIVDINTKEVEELPKQEDGVYYIVSTITIQALKAMGIERSDFISPNTSPSAVIRDENGNIVAVTSFQTL